MDASDLLLTLAPVGRRAIVKRTAAAGDVQLLFDDVPPNRVERFQQRRVARFEVEVGGAGVEVVRPYGMADRFALFHEGDAILVVVAADRLARLAHAEIAHVEKRLRQRQISLVTRRAVELDRPHVMRRTDRVPRQLRRRRREDAAKEVGGLSRDRQKPVVAGDAMVETRRGEQVPHVVHLKIMPIGERLQRLIAVAMGDQHRRMKVAVVSLSFRDCRN